MKLVNKKLWDILLLILTASAIVFGGFLSPAQLFKKKTPKPLVETLDLLCQKEIEGRLRDDEEILVYTHVYSGYKMPISTKEFRFNVITSQRTVKSVYTGVCLWDDDKMRVRLISFLGSRSFK